MLNLGAIVNAVGQRITMVQPRDIAAATTFATLRHDQLYRQFLWKDSVIMFTANIDTNPADYVPTNNYMPTKGNMILPPIFQQILAVRTAQWKMNVERPQVYFRIDVDEFNQTGIPFEFFLLSAAVWEFDTVNSTGLFVSNPADYGQIMTMDYQQAPGTLYLGHPGDGVTVQRSQVTLAANQNAAPQTDLIVGLQKPATQGQVQLVYNYPPGFGFITMQPTDTDAPKSQRFRFMSIPNQNTTVRVLGKRTTPPFSVNSDIPGVNGLDGIIFALTYYDMCHRDERGGTPESDKAMIEAVGPEFLVTGKVGGFLGKLIEEEVVQAAHNTRIMPEFGFGDCRDGWEYPSKAFPYG